MLTYYTDMEDLLDNITFACCICGEQHSHKDGTWLPVGVEELEVMERVSSPEEEPPMVILYSLRPPEILTSDKFTCYNCL